MFDLHDNYQSAYRRCHLIEIALSYNPLLKVHSDIPEALDEGFMTALIKIDSSATCDVINYPIKLARLELSFGIKDNVLT